VGTKGIGDASLTLSRFTVTVRNARSAAALPP
jgi:hypothetical protein